jgi:hypothetical protein
VKRNECLQQIIQITSLGMVLLIDTVCDEKARNLT